MDRGPQPKVRKVIQTAHQLTVSNPDFERILVELEAVKLNDSRLQKEGDSSESKARGAGAIRGPKVMHDDDDDSDWD
jgi:hypothetical protein